MQELDKQDQLELVNRLKEGDTETYQKVYTQGVRYLNSLLTGANHGSGYALEYIVSDAMFYTIYHYKPSSKFMSYLKLCIKCRLKNYYKGVKFQDDLRKEYKLNTVIDCGHKVNTDNGEFYEEDDTL